MIARKPLINFVILDQRWSSFISQNEIEKVFDTSASILGKDFSKDVVSVVFMSDEEIQEFNHTYRNKNKPTNVLSFPSTSTGELGDILLAFETTMQEAKEAGIPLSNHLYHLIVHGFLHLLGYDHETDEQANEMEKMEILTLTAHNIPNPYEDQ
jgi:probable rRNA maturation factor